MSETHSISTGIAARYASAAYDLASEAGGIAALEADVDSLETALAESDDFSSLIHSPIYSRDQQGRAIAALASAMGLTETMRNVLGLMAAKRRLFVLPQLLEALRARIADEKGEITAEVTTAQPLSDQQAARLAETLSEKSGKSVKLKTSVDESLIGGLIVKMGSQMIDTSIASKLSSLQNSMKEAR
ncbi:F0F1 ATP synthase subunit delta [Pseudoroseicyclus tamaricis]|uniref:ATP synthase subunit delta n=1 Tax=Pseudoroseicyclus tamaricis TaxID=2705421 RepID=A0A6B2JFS8_9RHOB|nr:F0F1 ATP synthase subunit delta [Pseudoroseicyclus tamaricis]NDU99922.1 F0F1 ATP synthase subunit delta [Pseudoroseicyclus tamaricis]